MPRVWHERRDLREAFRSKFTGDLAMWQVVATSSTAEAALKSQFPGALDVKSVSSGPGPGEYCAVCCLNSGMVTVHYCEARASRKSGCPTLAALAFQLPLYEVTICIYLH